MEKRHTPLENMERLTKKIILVTGGTGFVGGHLVDALIRRGNQVIVTYRSTDPRSYFFTQHLDKKAIMVQCDVKEYQRVLDVVTKYEVEYIFHLAAQSIVPTAYVNPLETLHTNIMGAAYVLEAARQYGKVHGIVVASSDKAYGKSHKTYTEDHPLQGDHPYEVSKSSEDLIAQMYKKTYGLPVVVTRFGNIYGPGDLHMNRIIPGIMKTMLTHKKLELRSDGTYVRDYVYVRDVVSGYLFLAEHIANITSSTFNLSSEDSLSVKQLIGKAEKLFRKRIPYHVAGTASNEIPFQHVGFEKIRKLGWEPTYTVHRGLRLTYGWYKKYKEIIF